MIFGVLAVGKSCVAIPKLHNHVLAADSSSFSLMIIHLSQFNRTVS